MGSTALVFPTTKEAQSLEELYGLAWYTYSKLERKDLHPASELVGSLEALIDEVLEYKNRLPYILYYRKAAVGILLSLYVLLKLKRVKYSTYKDLVHKVINIMDRWSWYDYHAEVIYAASLLSTVVPDIDKNKLLKLAEKSYRRGCLKVEEFKALQEDVENILYSILTFIKLKRYHNKLKIFIEILIKDYFVNRVFQDVNTLTLYCITFSRIYKHLNFIQRKQNVETVRRYLRPAFNELKKIAKHEYLTELNEEKLLRLDIKAKIELAKYEIGTIKRIVRRYTMFKRQRIKYELAILILIIYLTLTSYIIADYNMRIICQLPVSITVCEYVIEDLTGKRFISKAISRLVGFILKFKLAK